MTATEIDIEVRRLVHEQQQTCVGSIRTPLDQITDDKSFVDDLGFDSLDNVEFIMAVEDLFEIEVPDDDAENILTVGEAVAWLKKKLVTADDEDETCIARNVAFKEGDMVLDDVSGGSLHVACCGPEREGYVKDLDTEEPLGPDDPIPTGYAWTKWPTEAVPA